jgi:hypothetical protein
VQRYWIVFAFGILLYWRVNRATRRQAIVCNVMLLTLVLTMVLRDPARLWIESQYWKLELILVFMAAFVLVFGNIVRWDRRISCSVWLKPMFALATISYSVYLIHPLVVRFVRVTTEHWFQPGPTVTTLLLTPMITVFSILLGWALYWLVEARLGSAALQTERVLGTPALVPSAPSAQELSPQALNPSQQVNRQRDVRDESCQGLLTVIIPVYNEVATVGIVLSQVVKSPVASQIIVVDDGSTDGSTDVLAQWVGVSRLRILRHVENRGKGTAIRTAIPLATGRWTTIQDADLEVSPDEYPRLLEPLLRGDADVVYGSRYLGCSGIVARMTWSRLGVSLLNVVTRVLYGVRLTDEATCLKVFPTSVLKSMDLRCDRFEYCPEVTAKACRLGLRIAEVPIAYHPRTVTLGKKIRARDGWHALATLWRLRNWSPVPAYNLESATERIRSATEPDRSHHANSPSIPT